jgi:hypothetical protein
MRERSTSEAMLIATLAACPACKPSQAWLGRHAYPRTVRESGLLNTEFVGGETLTQDDMRRLEQLVDNTGAGTMRTGGGDLQSVLLLIPCSGGRGPGRNWSCLWSGWRTCLVRGQCASQRRVPLGFRSSGSATPLGLACQVSACLLHRTAIRDGRRKGGTRRGDPTWVALLDHLRWLWLITSGGFGVVHPEEPIHNYNAHLGTQTKSVWSRRLPVILYDYIERNQINESIVSCRSKYAACVPSLTANERRLYLPSGAVSTKGRRADRRPQLPSANLTPVVGASRAGATVCRSRRAGRMRGQRCTGMRSPCPPGATHPARVAGRR